MKTGRELDAPDDPGVYCPRCRSCGEWECCGSERCDQGEGCLYPDLKEWERRDKEAYDASRQRA